MTAPAPIEVGFSLGSNIGDKLGNLRRALEVLFAGPEVRFLACSSFYRTAPWGHTEQDWFVNACAVGETDLPPSDLLRFVKTIEERLGREKTFRWGPRLIDVDILYYGAAEVDEPELAIPHRQLFNRDFVLIPLAEIRPDLGLGGRSIAEEAARFARESLTVLAPPWSPGDRGPAQ